MRNFNPIMAAIVWLLCMVTTCAGQPTPEAAVVQLDGCSGVCVTPDGLILTADHCGSKENLDVLFSDGSKYRAALVYSPPQNGVDECQAYQIEDAAGLPYAIVASKPTEAGEPVWSVGYPFGNYQRNAGKVARVGYTISDTRKFQAKLSGGVVTDWQSDGGNSGGPLFDSTGNVVALLSMSSKGEPRSYWVGLDSIKFAIANRKAAAGSRRLVMFSRKGCSACDMFAAEIKRTESPVLIVKQSDRTFAEWQQAYKRHTGKDLDRYPTFWVESTAESRVEDYRPGLLQRILGWFGNTVREIVATFIGEREVSPRPRPDPIGAPPQELGDLPPAPTEAFDPANVTIVIAAAMQDVGAVKGVGIKLALSKIEGPLSRAVNERIGGKATLVLVPQRTQPERFAAVTSAARITANPAAVLVLVAKQSLGLKSLIAGKVESMLVGKVPDSVPVELIFERIHGEDFAAISLALSARETQNFKRSTESPPPVVTEEGIVAKLLPLLTTKIGDKLTKSDNALVSRLGETLKPEEPPPSDDGPMPTEQGIVGGVGLLVLERLRSMWLRRKAEKALIKAETEAAA